ncbi:hypothetical protein C0995_012809, partial [Termitomyces sp. Mi166
PLVLPNAGTFTDKKIETLKANSDVEEIYEDIIARPATVTQTCATWGLARLNSKQKLMNQNPRSRTFKYTYDENAGRGVDVYVIDTGVYVEHTDFGGRARWGVTFHGQHNKDTNGHGTHVAGIIAGSKFGVAKLANIIAVKVFDDNMYTRASIMCIDFNFEAGLEYAYTSAQASGRHSVVNLCSSTEAYKPLDKAVARMTNDVVIVVSAGNEGSKASHRSPGRSPYVITVAASNIFDRQTSISNWGKAVDILAPGEKIMSLDIHGRHSTAIGSGTSM